MSKVREVTPVGTYLSDEYQTPTTWVERFGKILGYIGLDPCYSEVPWHRFEPFANVTWGIKDNALGKSVNEWQAHGPIYMNFCFSAPGPWVDKIVQCDDVPWVVLTNTQSCAKWWHKLAAASDIVAFPRRRISFVDPTTGEVSKGNRYDQTIFVSGACEVDEDLIIVTNAINVLTETCMIVEPVI